MFETNIYAYGSDQNSTKPQMIYVVYMHMHTKEYTEETDNVSYGASLGTSGASGYGVADYYPDHLHYGIFVAENGETSFYNDTYKAMVWNLSPVNPLFFHQLAGQNITFDGNIEHLNTYYAVG